LSGCTVPTIPAPGTANGRHASSRAVIRADAGTTGAGPYFGGGAFLSSIKYFRNGVGWPMKPSWLKP